MLWIYHEQSVPQALGCVFCGSVLGFCGPWGFCLHTHDFAEVRERTKAAAVAALQTPSGECGRTGHSSFPRFLPSCSQSPASIPSPFCTCCGSICSWGAHMKAQKHGELELTEKLKVALGSGGRGGREAIRRIMKKETCRITWRTCC